MGVAVCIQQYLKARNQVKKGKQIAILLRHPQRLRDACRCGQALMENGAAVRFYCLCQTIGSKMHWNFKPLQATQSPCFTDNSYLASRYNLACLPFHSIVQGIESCDWVIPI